ncbi:MAG: hypothetical protein JWQ25_1120 [Daejeonella sp.]|nr:hypothetical protein [Daejeonella sp.]
MKASIYLIYFLFLTFSGCKKSPQDSHHYMNEAVISGPDFAMCPCCGGLKFRFINTVDSLPNVNRLTDDKNILGITNDTKYPLTVKLDWTLSSACSGHFINITRASK